MNRNIFIQSLFFIGTSPHLLTEKLTGDMEKLDSIGLLRHATIVINIGKLNVLVDPMLSAKGDMDPVQNCGNDIRIPMTELSVDKAALAAIIQEADAVMVTHTHRDHWDAAAQNMIPKNKLIICQPADIKTIQEQGFSNVQPLEHQLILKEITISRTGGMHGAGEIGKKMGEVSGFVFSNKQKSIYVAGDTIWCDQVAAALTTHKPDYTILNAGGAKFLTGDPITMAPKDIMSVHSHLPSTKIIAVHMDTVNHCFIKRTDLTKALAENNLAGKVIIPADGEVINI